MKIDLLIWSFDRAAQLNGLISSIERFCSIFNISIIYNYSNHTFGYGYEKLIANTKNILWIKELPNRFFGHTQYAISQGNSDFISFATDDCIFYRQIDKVALSQALPRYNNQVFSFRLGYNTIIQNIHDNNKSQPPLNFHIEHENYLSWPIDKYYSHDNYGYPFGLDLHVFRRDLINQIFKEIEFQSTNELESILTNNYRHLIDEMRSFKQSCAVNIPINTVTKVTKAGEKYSISKEELNQKYLDGYVIDLEDIENTTFKSCHAEIPIKFIK